MNKCDIVYLKLCKALEVDGCDPFSLDRVKKTQCGWVGRNTDVLHSGPENINHTKINSLILMSKTILDHNFDI